MNRIAALVISTILLTQIASYSYGDIPAQIEWEEPLQGDPDWKVSGRNSSSGCNNSSVWFEVEPYQQEWNALDTVSVYLDTYCGIWNNSYMVSWWVIDNANNSIIDYGNTSFETNSSSVSYHPNHTYHFNEYDIHLHYMETGNYTVFGHFSVWSNNSWSLLANESSTFEVNSTMTTTVCGFNSTFVDMETDLQSTIYFAGSSVHPWSDIECPMLNTAYMYTWEMYNLNTSTVTHSGNDNFTATWQNVNMFSDGSGFYYDLHPHASNLTEGAYILSTNLWLASSGLVDSSNVSFSVIPDYWNNTGGNNTTNAETISINLTGYTNLYQSNQADTGYWNSGTAIGGEFVSSNLSYNETYFMTWGLLSGWSGNTQIINQGNVSWTALSSTSTEFVQFNLSDGQYMFQTHLYDISGNYLSHDMSFMQVGTSSGGNNTGGNNTGGNNTGGNNTGGNNTGGNNTGGNNTGGNNTGGNNTGGNNTGGNNTGGNNTGGNNTGGNNTIDYDVDYGGFLYDYCYSLNESILFYLQIAVPGGTDLELQWQVTDIDGDLVASDVGTLFLDASGEFISNLSITPTDGSSFFEAGEYTLFVNLIYTNNQSNIFSDSPYYYSFEVDCYGGNNTTSGELEWWDYSVDLDEDCIEGPFYVNGTLYDIDNITGGSTEFYYTIYHVDETGLETPTGMSYSTTVSFDSNGSADVSIMIDPTGYADGQYYIHLYTNSSGDNLNQMYWFTLGCDDICGYDSSLINSDYEIWSSTFGNLFTSWNQTTNDSNSVNDDTPLIYQGDSLYAGMWFSCLVHGEDYLANLTITDDANSLIYSDEEYFTQSSWSHWYDYYQSNISTTNLPPGEYCLTFTLYVSPFGSSDIVFTVTECVEIVSLDDWDGCGSNLTYLEHLQDVTGNPFVQQGTVFLTTSSIWYNNFVDCLVIGENYTMVTTVTHDGSLYMQETDNFSVNQFSDITQWSWGTISHWGVDISIGNYCVETTIHSTDSTYTNMIALVSTVTDCFAVVELTPVDWWDDQTGNNTTGSPNNPIMPDTNCTNLSSSLSGLNLTNAFNMSDCENGTGFWFNLTVNGTGVNWYDPVYAVGYDFEVLSGPKFASVVVPPGYGDDKYDIYLWDGSEYVLAASDLDALTQYWFTDDGQITTTPGDYDGITMFSIRGLELDAKLDPDDPNAFVTGLTFVQDPNDVSEVVLSMNPIRVSDEDDDGIADADDNCVDDANADQADADGNGIGDACESAASGGGSDDGGTDDEPDSSSDSNRTLAYAALLAVALVAVLVMFGREDER